ncbi:MAG: hypothetical protein MSG64_01995 [Pyrinomonadaceae bacterium MAG19_C2-C3]|nr:hypothetical protein [Pyrinomonadaceae bacterium MAG19_C2-C3]
MAFARTLVQSFHAVHPNYRCFVLLIDDYDGFINPADEAFEIVSLHELSIADLPGFCFKYDITELSTAVKAAFLKHLLREKGVSEILYLDPDILVTNSLDNLYQKLSTHDILLTPHLDTDYPDDGELPDDSHIMRSGVYNLGFIGIKDSPNTLRFLDWWDRKLYSKCLIEPTAAYFVDQKFIDIAQTLFDNIYVERSVGYNVAYWNIHSRHIHNQNGKLSCNEVPLCFYHFSGYNPSTPDIISRFITRCSLSERTDLQPLFAEYRKRLLENGHEQIKHWSYSFGHFTTGEEVTNDIRISYRNAPERWRDYGNPFASAELRDQAARMVKIPPFKTRLKRKVISICRNVA